MFKFPFRPSRARSRGQASALRGHRAPSRAPEVKAISPLIALSLAGRPQWGGRDYASLAREGVMKNAIVYRCVRMIAEGAASIPWLLYEGAQELETHPLLSLLTRPNAARIRQRIVRALVCHAAMRGQCLSRSADAGRRPRASSMCCAPTA